jgi:hypothetical protein
MPEVGGVVRGDAAHIQGYFVVPQGKFFDGLRFGVVKFHQSFLAMM